MTQQSLQQVYMTHINEDNISLLQQINNTVLPVSYSPQSVVYKHLLANGKDFSYLALVKQDDASFEAVGGIACRLENDAHNVKLYIATLAVLAPYRRLGIGRAILNKLLTQVAQFNQSHKEQIKQVYLHVKTDNDDAIDFYKQFAFEISEKIPNYYKKLAADCYILTKHIE